MNIPTFKDQPEFAESAVAADKSANINTQEPNILAVGSDASLAAIVQSFIATQSQTNRQLIEYIGKGVAGAANEVTIGDQTLNNENQQHFLSEIASYQNLLSRQLKTRPSSDSEAVTIYKLKGKSSNMRTGQSFK